MVVAGPNESTFPVYRLGFPLPGRWLEAFNSDVYDHFVNPHVAGNDGSVNADGPPWQTMPASAEIAVPANGVVVLVKDARE